MGPQFVTNVLTWAPFAATQFIDGPDTDCQLFYNQLKFNYIGQRRIKTELRDIAEFTLEHIPDPGQKPDTLVIYAMHLKANVDADGIAQRGREINALRAALTQAPYQIACGDYNVYSAQEPAYTGMVSPSSGMVFVDPMGTDWVRNSAGRASIYTQSTRQGSVSGCGGGSAGGLDDRFDLILFSEPLAARVVPGTYTPFGNDGLARLSGSINNPPNTRVSATIADALLCASDHLPVYADVILGDVKAGVEEQDGQGAQLHARFEGDVLVIDNCTVGVLVMLFTVEGQVVWSKQAALQSQTVLIPHIAAGLYYLRHGDDVIPILR
jgi:hypothetical protein